MATEFGRGKDMAAGCRTETIAGLADRSAEGGDQLSRKVRNRSQANGFVVDTSQKKPPQR
jgi:hypothetical protein